MSNWSRIFKGEYYESLLDLLCPTRSVDFYPHCCVNCPVLSLFLWMLFPKLCFQSFGRSLASTLLIAPSISSQSLYVTLVSCMQTILWELSSSLTFFSMSNKFECNYHTHCLSMKNLTEKVSNHLHFVWHTLLYLPRCLSSSKTSFRQYVP